MADWSHRLQALLGEGGYALDTPAPPRRAWNRPPRRTVRALAIAAMGWVLLALL